MPLERPLPRRPPRRTRRRRGPPLRDALGRHEPRTLAEGPVPVPSEVWFLAATIRGNALALNGAAPAAHAAATSADVRRFVGLVENLVGVSNRYRNAVRYGGPLAGGLVHTDRAFAQCLAEVSRVCCDFRGTAALFPPERAARKGGAA